MPISSPASVQVLKLGWQMLPQVFFVEIIRSYLAHIELLICMLLQLYECAVAALPFTVALTGIAFSTILLLPP